MAKPDDIPKADPEEIERLIERLKQDKIEPKDRELIERLLRMVLTLIRILQKKNASLSRLKRMIFGPGSDRRPAGETGSEATKENEFPTESDRETNDAVSSSTTSEKTPKRAGHGRMSASAYESAKIVICRHTDLRAGDECPDPYCRGHLYDTSAPSIFIQLTGQPLVGATRYEQEVLRCSACQERFTAPLPAEVAPEKYDATCDVSIAMAKYGAGLPWHRLEQVQRMCGTPLPAAVQFERCEAVANAALPVFLKLRELAANGEVIHGDDTRVRILSHFKKSAGAEKGERRGTHTTGLVVETGGRKIALYANGKRHAGENLDELLTTRNAGLEPPIQMSDALPANWSGKTKTIEAKCLAHARRKFVEIEAIFPAECGVVLDAIAKVYKAESEAEGMSASDRLAHHQAVSGPVVRDLREWMETQFSARKVEPNSSLGQAIRYALKHWDGLTRFLSVAKAPLDNNPAERALKRAVLLRKNALFYKNDHGAMVGAILQSVIETCRLNEVNAWEYLLRLTRNAREARRNPEAFLPWSYARGEPEREAA
jgi:hypothetical protein